ncbi:hypothetical protein PILCRDRAFT_826603 [Piloderma croceum F 1598]|uniref:Uncharacterized protein n=1 Tax=Piloderma croceum (strain F 1598) TaxID=765440 RepID=A0A0C3AQP0_PILCF|nr:hypothetical protein PILCRDRAFT_826603 [Piloderma croceum F 1598]
MPIILLDYPVRVPATNPVPSDCTTGTPREADVLCAWKSGARTNRSVCWDYRNNTRFQGRVHGCLKALLFADLLFCFWAISPLKSFRAFASPPGIIPSQFRLCHINQPQSSL